MKKVLIYINNLSGILLIVRSSFQGQYKIKNKAFNKMKDEVLNKPIPSIHDDKVNLRNDSLNVYSDYRKAFNEKKAAILNG